DLVRARLGRVLGGRARQRTDDGHPALAPQGDVGHARVDPGGLRRHPAEGRLTAGARAAVDVWDVLGKRTAADEWTLVGGVTAPDEQMALLLARETHF